MSNGRCFLRLVLALAGWFAHDAAAQGAGPQVERVRTRLSSGELHWAGDPEGGAPFQFYEPDSGALTGFETELVTAIVEQLKRQLDLPKLNPVFHPYDWGSLPQGLVKGDFDLIVSGMEITDDNRRAMIFSRPYYVYSQQLTVRADEQKVKSVDDCVEAKVGTLAGSAAQRYLVNLGAKQLTSYDGQIEPYQDLAIGRVDAVLLDLPIAIYNAGDEKKFKFVGERVGKGHYGIGLRAGDGDLAAVLDVALAELMRTGKIRDIYTKWRIWNDDQFALALPDRPEELAGLKKESLAEVNQATSRQHWPFRSYAPLLLKAAGVTVALTCASMAVAMAIGLVVAMCRLYGPAPVRIAALAYVELFRGTPLLLLLTFLYFGLPNVPYIGVSLASWQAAIIGFGLNYAAFEAEIYRSSIMAVPRGQWEAAHALGMNNTATFRRIIFPQAIRTALGPMTNDFVAMFKDTSLVSVIAVIELTQQYQILARSSLMWLEMGLLTALLYLAMSVPLGYLARYLEDKWSAGIK